MLIENKELNRWPESTPEALQANEKTFIFYFTDGTFSRLKGETAEKAFLRYYRKPALQRVITHEQAERPTKEWDSINRKLIQL